MLLETIAIWDKGLKVTPPSKTVFRNELGGALDQHWKRFTLLLASGDQVEIRGKCQSACTLIMARIPKSRLCFADNAHLAFHWARHVSGDGPLDREGTQWMLDRYPDDLRAWINSMGGGHRTSFSTNGPITVAKYSMTASSCSWKSHFRPCFRAFS
jgi:hypothetical protein